MKLDNKLLFEILTTGHYLDEQQTTQAKSFVGDAERSLFQYLLEQNILTKDLIGQAIAEHLKVPYADLNSRIPTREMALKIPESTAKKSQAVLFSESDKSVVIASSDPTKKGLASSLKKYFKGKKITIQYSLPEDIQTVLLYYRKPLPERLKTISKRDGYHASAMLEEVFHEAVIQRASDIHFEPRKDHVLLRMRIDGVLLELVKLDHQDYTAMINRIKIQSNMRIDQHNTTQDGAMKHQTSTGSVDLRVSIVPTLQGEKTVMRVLSNYAQKLVLADLGLSETDEAKIVQASRKPFGMILVVGPTGSGKTTTLYSLIKILNQPDINITTIEDPVEYRIEGINQIRVNPEAEVTFSRGLRSIVRQDPDIILVGEIRDRETSEIAVNAALTGHLLLSTFHANDAATAIPRLLDMGIEPFLLSSTLELIIGQRLVRKVCEQCRYSYQPTKTDLNQYGPDVAKFLSDTKTMYRGRGCSVCQNSGYHGRTGIFEMVTVSEPVRNLTLNNPTASEIWEIARKEGSVTLFEDGIRKVKLGETTIEELLRVAEPPHHVKTKAKKKK